MTQYTNTSASGNWMWSLVALAAVALAAAGGCGGASAAKPAETKGTPQGHPTPKAATLELGEFLFSQARPLENSTLNVRFQAYAATAEANAKPLKKKLSVHRHQAREQILIACRTAETWEYDEPDLHKVRRRIVLGLNRWLGEPLVEDIFLAEFRMRID